MELSREQQIEFAKEMLPLLENESDTAKLERLNKLASLLIDWMDKDDNGLAEQSKKSLLSQIDNQ